MTPILASGLTVGRGMSLSSRIVMIYSVIDEHLPNFNRFQNTESHMGVGSTRRRFLQNVTGSIALGWMHFQTAEGLQAKLDGSSVTEAIERLKPGEYLWAPAVAPSGPVLAIVSLPVQRCSVYRNGVLIGVSTISTGKSGHRTPTGVFTVLQKHRSQVKSV